MKPAFSLQASFDAGAGGGESDALATPDGWDVGSMQVATVCSNFGGSTVTTTLQGCNEDTPTNWSPVFLPPALGGGEVAVARTTTGADFAGTGDRTFVAGQYRWIRIAVTVSGGGPSAAGTSTAYFSGPGSVASNP